MVPISTETNNGVLSGNIHTLNIYNGQSFAGYIQALKANLACAIKTSESNTHRQWDAGYYRSGSIQFQGRQRELEKLEKFCLRSEPVLWTAVTGPGACGKSRLVYQYFREHWDEQEWDMVYLSGSEIKRINDHFIYSFDYEKNLLIALDYINANAKDIGEWIAKLPNNAHKYRIILIERARLTDDNEPFWFSQLKKSISHLMFPCLDLRPLDQKDLNALAKQYAGVLQKQVTDEIIESQLLKPLEQIDPQFKRPLFLIYILQAWAAGKDVNQWDQNQLLNFLF